MNVTFTPTPFGTVHVTAVIPAQQSTKARRSIASQAGHRGLGKRLTVREHTIGDVTTVFAIYPKGL